MRIYLPLTLVLAGCAVQPAPQPAPQRTPQQAAFAYCSEPLRSESISGPLQPTAVPPAVAALAKERFRTDLAQQPPTGAWYSASDGAYLFCSHRLDAARKNCGSERQFYRLEDGNWQTAEDDMVAC